MRGALLVLAAGLAGLTLSGCACCGPCWTVGQISRDAVGTTGRIAGGGLKLTGKAAGGLLAESDGFVHRTASRLQGKE